MASSANSANEKHFPAIKVQESVNNRPSIKEPLVSPRQTEMVPQATSTKDEAYDMLHSGFKPSELYPISTCECGIQRQLFHKKDAGGCLLPARDCSRQACLAV